MQRTNIYIVLLLFKVSLDLGMSTKDEKVHLLSGSTSSRDGTPKSSPIKHLYTENTKKLGDASSIGSSASELSDQEVTSPKKEASKPHIKRWLMLAIFSLNSMMNACLFISVAPINDLVSKYWDVEPHFIDWLPNIYFFLYTLLALPAAFSMGFFGLRPLLLLGSAFNAVATCLRFGGTKQNGFIFVLIGQLVAALGYCTILQVPARLSAIWFPVAERAMATSIGAFMNIFGVSLGFLMCTQMVQETDDLDVIGKNIHDLFLVEMVICLLLLILVFFLYDEKPPMPVDADTEEEENDIYAFLKSIKYLALDMNFNLMAQGYAIYFALFNVFSILLNTMVVSKYSSGFEKDIGWMGFSCDVASIPSAFVLGMLLDKFRHYRFTAVFLNFSALLVMLTFMLVLRYTNSFLGIFILYVIYGVVGIPYFCCGLEQAAVLTSPIPEMTSSAVILVLGNLYGFVLVLVLGYCANSGHIDLAGYIMVGLYCISTFLAYVTKMKNIQGDRLIEEEDDDV